MALRIQGQRQRRRKTASTSGYQWYSKPSTDLWTIYLAIIHHNSWSWKRLRVHNDKALFTIESLNNSTEKELRTISHVMKTFIIYAGYMDQCLECTKGGFSRRHTNRCPAIPSISCTLARGWFINKYEPICSKEWQFLYILFYELWISLCRKIIKKASRLAFWWQYKGALHSIPLAIRG
jgi:hypothetical protein